MHVGVSFEVASLEIRMETVIQQPLHSSYVFLHIWFHSRSDFWFVAFQGSKFRKHTTEATFFFFFTLHKNSISKATHAEYATRMLGLSPVQEMKLNFFLTRGAALQFQTEDDE